MATHCAYSNRHLQIHINRDDLMTLWGSGEVTGFLYEGGLQVPGALIQVQVNREAQNHIEQACTRDLGVMLEARRVLRATRPGYQNKQQRRGKGRG